MRIIFMGTPAFAVPSLDILVRHGYDIVAVVTSLDSYGGRGGKQLIESDIKKYAVEKGLLVLQPKNLKAAEFVESLKALRADLQVVVAFRMLPEVVWNMPPMGTINLHGSLLPKYRGAAPINHAIMQGEKTTGVTSFKLQHAIDTGDIILQKKLDIDDDDNFGSLHDKMKILGAEVVLSTIEMFQSNTVKFYPQSDEKASAAPKINLATCQINFNQSSATIHNFVRGLSPYPGAWTTLDGKILKVLKTKFDINSDDFPVGSIISDHKKTLMIKCTDGYIHLLSIKPEGKNVMTVHDFLNGHKLSQNNIML